MRMRVHAAALAVAAFALAGAPAANAAPLGFSAPIFVTDAVHHTVIYSSHEGTTHIYRPGLASSTTFTFLAGYRNQVNIWISRDSGRTWKRNDFGGGFTSDPTKNTGFSDPDLTQDAGGRIYDTGINLANDALFSSPDGGQTWDRGTIQCHDGDRPWLAGARRDEVFMATNTAEGSLSHSIFRSADGGQTCSSEGIPDAGTLSDGTDYTGNGKIYYEPGSQRLVEPVNFMRGGRTVGLGVGTWKRGDKAFTPHKAVDTSLYAHWAAIALDGAGGLYLVYDDDPRQAGTTGGCDGSATPVPNHIRMVHSLDFGRTWSAPLTLASPPGARVLWPWIAAGDQGKVSVVWYQTDKLVDLACQTAKLSVEAASVTGADTASPHVQVVDPIGRPVSENNICQSGTTCVATGEDRRLGDFFTNALDEQGCVMIGTGDTSTKDPLTGGERNIALPLFVRQSSGPALRGGGDCSARPASLIAGGGKRRCLSRRHFTIHIKRRILRGDRVTRATVYINGKRVKRVRIRGRRAIRIDLRGRRKGTFTLTVEARTTKGRRLRDTRRYHTCAKKRRHHRRS
jgi:hypothetical protein